MLIPTAVMDVDLLCCIRFIIGIFVRQAQRNLPGLRKMYGKFREMDAEAGVEALADFIREIGLPTTLREVGVEKKEDLKEIADSCYLVDGSYKKMTHEEILEIFLECF